MNEYTPPLADGPINNEIHVFKNSEWSRTFSILNRDTREVKDVTGILFSGTVSLNGTVVGSFVFAKPSDEEFSVTLPTSTINALDSTKCYDYDWFLVEDGIREVFAKSKLKKFETATPVS
jgi:hypothetical protein